MQSSTKKDLFFCKINTFLHDKSVLLLLFTARLLCLCATEKHLCPIPIIGRRSTSLNSRLDHLPEIRNLLIYLVFSQNCSQKCV